MQEMLTPDTSIYHIPRQHLILAALTLGIEGGVYPALFKGAHPAFK